MVLGVLKRVMVPAAQIIPIYAPFASLSFNPRNRYRLSQFVKIDFEKASLCKVDSSFDGKSFCLDVY